MIVPLIITFKLKGNIQRPSDSEALEHIMNPTTPFERKFIFFLGVVGLLFVPVFKTLTHHNFTLNPIKFRSNVSTTELLHRSKNYEAKSDLTVIGVLKKVDVPTIFFFLGILLVVASLQSMGYRNEGLAILDNTFDGNIYAINIIIGLFRL